METNRRISIPRRRCDIDMVSHEIRTPLNAIIGFSQLISIDSSASNETKQQAKIIESAAWKLFDFIQVYFKDE